MFAAKKNAINNTFQIIEEFKPRRISYTPPGNIRSCPKAQPRGGVKIFSRGEILLYKLKSKGENKDEHTYHSL